MDEDVGVAVVVDRHVQAPQHSQKAEVLFANLKRQRTSSSEHLGRSQKQFKSADHQASQSISNAAVPDLYSSEGFRNVSLPTTPCSFSHDECTVVAASVASTAASAELASEEAESQTGGELPIWCRHREIISSVRRNKVTVVVGEPGSGKTTQIPQMILRAWQEGKLEEFRGMAITQPRRVAAITLASRVLDEMKTSTENQHKKDYNKDLHKKNDKESIRNRSKDLLLESLGGTVGYSVRFDQRASRETRIKFLTDGCLLREAVCDPLLKRYSVVIIDEVHQRGVRTELLMGLLKIILTQRKHLRIIVMSATVDYRAFTSFFGQGHVVIVPGRQYPVTLNHLTMKPTEDRLQDAVSAVLQLHLTKAEGDILVFLPGQEEIEGVRSMLEMKKKELQSICSEFVGCEAIVSRLKDLRKRKSWKCFAQNSTIEDKRLTTEYQTFLASLSPSQVDFLKQLEKQLSEGLISNGMEMSSERVLDISLELKLAADLYFPLNENFKSIPNFQLLPLYAALAPASQALVFQPASCRKIILATNIAETSVTIPGVRYVVDLGLHKVKTFDSNSNIEKLSVQTISRAMANQRSGRAGREGPGESFRLFTLEDYYDMEVQAEPEIKRSNLSQVVLELKAMGVKDPAAFPFLTAPSPTALTKAIESLRSMKALDPAGNITALGRQLVALPLAPELGKFLLDSVHYGCTAEALTIAALLNADQLWLNNTGKSGKVGQARSKVISVFGDHLSLVNAYVSWETSPDKKALARALGLNYKTLIKARNIRDQLKGVLLSPAVGLTNISSCMNETGPNGLDAIRKCLVQSFPANIARLSNSGPDEKTFSTAAYIIEASRIPVSIHPSSSLFGKPNKPAFVVFNELVHTSKLYMRVATAVEGEWVQQIHPLLHSSAIKAVKSPVASSNKSFIQMKARLHALSHVKHYKQKAY